MLLFDISRFKGFYEIGLSTFFIFTLFSGIVYAASSSKGTEGTSTLAELSVSKPFAQENWYTFWGLGISNNTYFDPAIKNIINTFTTKTGGSRIAFHGELYGFYWPLNEWSPKTLVGANVQGIGDFYFYSVSDKAGAFAEMLVGPGAFHFLGQQRGDGFFLRTLLGLSKFSYDVKVNGGGHSLASSPWGVGALMGSGYALPISNGARLMLGINYLGLLIDQKYLSSVNFSTGLLF